MRQRDGRPLIQDDEQADVNFDRSTAQQEMERESDVPRPERNQPIDPSEGSNARRPTADSGS